ncbi:MAG: chemotaxis protein CheW, partial [Planctomycetales bacterium]|nr:chemotaxis protein CheW [Planctomycetales bacterium]
FNSPLELDAYLVSAIWERLAPTLAPLSQVESAAPIASAPAEKTGDEHAAQQDKSNGNSKKRYLRVHEDHVDKFLEDVSNVFIACERLKDLQFRMASQLPSNGLVDELRQITSNLTGQSTAMQKSVVELRKVPIRNLFSKFPRMARSLASKLGKQLDVHLQGEDEEVDKSLVEDLDGPLMHMVRNVCDHGIETPEQRRARGANETGNLWIECSRTKTHVVITVRDDGRGIDPNRLRNKAIERGLYSAAEAAALTDQQAVELVFHPGLSTAEEVTEVSGRGVGLDVVQSQLREHDGDVSVVSRVGEGTTFRMQIPIRRALVVVDGLLVRQCDSTFVIPIEHVQEITRPEPSDMSYVHGKPIVKVRGNPYGALPLSALLDNKATDSTDAGALGVLITSNRKSLVLLVDAVLGQRKVVVTDLSRIVATTAKIAGVAQLGGGSLALALNVTELIEGIGGQPQASRAPATCAQ